MPHFSWKLTRAILRALGLNRECLTHLQEESLVTTRIKKKSLPEQSVTVPGVDILRDAEDGLWALSARVGLRVLPERMSAEVEQLAGPKGRHDPQRQAVRHGTEVGSVFLGDRKISQTPPRVRAADGSEEIS